MYNIVFLRLAFLNTVCYGKIKNLKCREKSQFTIKAGFITNHLDINQVVLKLHSVDFDLRVHKVSADDLVSSQLQS